MWTHLRKKEKWPLYCHDLHQSRYMSFSFDFVLVYCLFGDLKFWSLSHWAAWPRSARSIPKNILNVPCIIIPGETWDRRGSADSGAWNIERVIQAEGTRNIGPEGGHLQSEEFSSKQLACFESRPWLVWTWRPDDCSRKSQWNYRQMRGIPCFLHDEHCFITTWLAGTLRWILQK